MAGINQPSMPVTARHVEITGVIRGYSELCIRNHPLVPRTTPIHGLIFDVASGRLTEGKGADSSGKGCLNPSNRWF